MNSRLSGAFYFLAVLGVLLAVRHASFAEDTNMGLGTMRPLAPMKPLTPIMKPLGPPPDPILPSAPSTPASTGTAPAAGASEAARGSAPFKITSFMSSQIPEPMIDAKGKRITEKYFRVQFKITEPGITSLDSAVVYLFNQKKELAGSLTDFNPQVKLSGTNVKENALNYPNMLTQLTGLEKNRNYNLIFMYTMNEIQFKYAVAVIGNKEKVVGDTIPGSAKIEEFNFDGKNKLVQ